VARILVIGPGRVGTAVAIALKNAHHTIVGAVGRAETSASCTRFKQLDLGETICLEDSRVLSKMVHQSDILLLGVRDGVIAPLAEQLATKLTFRGNQLVCHTSGATGLGSLRSLKRAGAMVGCLHPLQTFANPVLGASKIANSYFAITGDEPATSVLCNLVRSLGATPFFLPDNEKARYHAGAALASNALVALIYTALSLMPDKCGLNALLPLIEGTIANLRQVGLKDALTGPIERGDIQTVLNHLEALTGNKDAKLVYEALGKVTVTVASMKGSLNEETKLHLLEVLQNDGEEA
jgi:predicted short-subunit dehydrogenase-like oxidoreductase (DUF2520 family)